MNYEIITLNEKVVVGVSTATSNEDPEMGSKIGYTVTAGCEVSASENDKLTTKVIPAGRYAKFSLHGPMEAVVAQAWEEIWQTPLDRSFTGDFEEYLNSDFENADVDIYIALK